MIAPHAAVHHMVKAGRFWQMVLALCDTPALTMPWHKVYIHPDHWGHLDIRLHEAVHLEQIRRHGPIMFSLRYLCDLAIVGYWESEYEQEARAAHETPQGAQAHG